MNIFEDILKFVYDLTNYEFYDDEKELLIKLLILIIEITN